MPRYPNRNKNLRIKSIRKGTGANGYWRVGEDWKQILLDTKEIRWGGDGRPITGIVYYIYDHNDNLVVEVEPCAELTITYYREDDKMEESI